MRFDIPVKLLCQTDISHRLAHGIPVNVEIDLCNRCSLGCEFCHFAYTHTGGPLSAKRSVEVGDRMDTELAKNLISQLVDLNVQSITFSGGGEPTLHPDCLEILEWGKSLRIQKSIGQGMYTNGCHIKDSDAWRYARYLDWVYVSLDAADATEYKNIKQVDGFDAACRGIQRLVSAGATVGVGCVVTEQNVNRLDSIVRLAYLYGAAYVQFRPAVRYSSADPSILVESAEWALEVEKPSHPGIRIEMDLDRFRMYGNWIKHGYPVCWWSNVQTVVTPDGRVWVCCNKRGIEDACIGDLNKERFIDIWSRRPVAMVDHKCRIMCRGHMGNQILDRVMSGTVPNANFV